MANQLNMSNAVHVDANGFSAIPYLINNIKLFK